MKNNILQRHQLYINSPALTSKVAFILTLLKLTALKKKYILRSVYLIQLSTGRKEGIKKKEIKICICTVYDISLEKLVLDQLIIPWLIFLFILITSLLGIVLQL